MRALLAQLTRFATVGGVATLIHIGVAWAVHAAGVTPLAANAAGFAAAFMCSYLGHFHWTFPGGNSHASSLPRFLVVSGVGFALTNVIVWGAGQADLPFQVALAAILITVPLATWTLSRLWAFR